MPRSHKDPFLPSTPRAQDFLAGLLRYGVAVALMLTAWVLVFTDDVRAAASALLPALLILALYGANRIRFRTVLERAVLLVGVWTLVAPVALRFAASDGATLAHVAVGGMTIAIAVMPLRWARQP